MAYVLLNFTFLITVFIWSFNILVMCVVLLLTSTHTTRKLISQLVVFPKTVKEKCFFSIHLSTFISPSPYSPTSHLYLYGYIHIPNSTSHPHYLHSTYMDASLYFYKHTTPAYITTYRFILPHTCQ